MLSSYLLIKRINRANYPKRIKIFTMLSFFMESYIKMQHEHNLYMLLLQLKTSETLLYNKNFRLVIL